jgi:phosphoenolpyruvate synthase/pyruvate phosphate dikinase
VKYSPIFKFSPDPGLFFTSLFFISEFGVGPSVFFLKDGRWEFWYETKWEETLAKTGLDFFSDKDKFEDYKKEIIDSCDKFSKSWPVFIETDFKNKSDEEFLGAFKKFKEEWVRFFSLYHYTEFYFYDLIEKKIKTAIESADPENANNNISILLRHDSEQGDFFESKFAEYKKLLYPEAEIEKNFSKQSVDPSEHIKLEKDLDLSKEIIDLLEAVRDMQGIKYFFRLFLNKSTFGDDSVRNKVVVESARILKTDPAVVELMTIDETEQALNKKSFDLKKIMQRKDLYAAKLEDNRYEIFTGDKALLIINEVKAIDSSQIKGMVANRGEAQGRAKVIKLTTKTDLLGEQIRLMDEGQVLVADTTGPELIVACKKAAAIVTNEGGITSHAAIVSRELNIPCIIGTKHATDIIKDGDMLKVDAINGIVEIIS